MFDFQAGTAKLGATPITQPTCSMNQINPKSAIFGLYQVDPTSRFSPAEFHGLWKIKSEKKQLAA